MDQEQQIINDLVEAGALEIAGIDEKSGEILYRITSSMQTINPELFAVHQQGVHDDAMYLWEHGFLDINVTEENPLVKATKKALDPVSVAELPISKRLALEEILSILL